MRRATTAHSSRSARNLGKMRPRLTSPSECPARPTRCRPRLTDFGDSTWITRSTAPMSMPSSSEEVATRQGSWPDLSISSTTRRSSWESEPWWARAISSSAQLVEALGEALGGAPCVDEDDRRVVFLDELEQLRVDRGPDRADVGVGLALGGDALGVGEVRRAGLAHVLDRHDDLQVELLGDPGIDDLALALRADEELRDPLQRALRRGEADPLQRVRFGRSPRAAPASAPGASRAWTGRPRGSRRRSPPRPPLRISRASEERIR